MERSRLCLRWPLNSLFSFVLVGVLFACSVVPQKPEIKFVGVELAGFAVTEQRLIIKLAVRNPNDRELLIKALDFEVEANDQPFAKSHALRPVVVPPKDEAILELTAVGDLVTALQQRRLQRKNRTEKSAYRLFGTVQVDGLGTIPFNRNGAFP